jgi:hypothetical protein
MPEARFLAKDFDMKIDQSQGFVPLIAIWDVALGRDFG